MLGVSGTVMDKLLCVKLVHLFFYINLIAADHFMASTEQSALLINHLKSNHCRYSHVYMVNLDDLRWENA